MQVNKYIHAFIWYMHMQSITSAFTQLCGNRYDGEALRGFSFV